MLQAILTALLLIIEIVKLVAQSLAVELKLVHTLVPKNLNQLLSKIYISSKYCDFENILKWIWIFL